VSAADGTVGEALTKLLDDAIPAERARKTSLEARSLAVITSSGVLVSLLFGLGAVVTKANDYRPPTGVLVLLIVAAATYTSAAVLAIAGNLPGRYYEIDADSLAALASPEEWSQPGADAEQQLALARLGLLTDWRRVNERKAYWLILAAAAESAGILITTAALIVILASA